MTHLSVAWQTFRVFISNAYAGIFIRPCRSWPWSALAKDTQHPFSPALWAGCLQGLTTFEDGARPPLSLVSAVVWREGRGESPRASPLPPHAATVVCLPAARVRLRRSVKLNLGLRVRAAPLWWVPPYCSSLMRELSATLMRKHKPIS